MQQKYDVPSTYFGLISEVWVFELDSQCVRSKAVWLQVIGKNRQREKRRG